MQFDSATIIAGLPLLEVRRLLRARDNGLVLADVQRLLRVTQTRASEVLAGLEHAGLLQLSKEPGVPLWLNTIRGNALAAWRALPPLPRAKAQGSIDEFLDRVREANSRHDFVFYVTRVDLFGSCLTGAELVNDVDLAVELTPRQADDEAFEAACEAARQTARQAGRRFRSLTDELGWPERQLLLFLQGRSRRLSLHVIRELQRLGVPSETIFRVGLPA